MAIGMEMYISPRKERRIGRKKILKCAVVCNDAHWVIHVQICLMQCHIVRNLIYQMENHRFTYYTILFFPL